MFDLRRDKKSSRHNFERFLRYTAAVDGWLNYEDYCVISSILSWQSTRIKSNVFLEIGVFEGKTTLLLTANASQGDRIHICDIFDGATSPDNMLENLSSYRGLSKNRFDLHMRTYSKILPTVWKIDSRKLFEKDFENDFTFIHIDGSHLFDFVKSDLEFSIQHIDKKYGILVVDDYREFHTPGVSAAVWNLILSQQLFPFAMTPRKLYCTLSPGIISIEEFLNEFNHKEFSFFVESFLEFSFIRVLAKSQGRITTKLNHFNISLLRRVKRSRINARLTRGNRIEARNERD